MKSKIFSTLLLFVYLTTNGQNLELGKKMFYFRRFLSSEKEFSQDISINPNNAESYFWLTLTKSELNKTEEADKIISKAPESIISNPYLNISKGILSLSKNDSLTARNFFNNAIGKERKKDPSILYSVALANVVAKNGDNTYAINLIEEAAKKDKKNPLLFIIEGDAFRKIYDGSNAFKKYNQALALDNKNALAYYKLGTLFQSQNNKDLYLTNYTKAVESDPEMGLAYYQLFYIFYAKNPSQAGVYLEKYMNNSDKSTETDYLKVDMLFLLKRYQDAITIAKQIISTEDLRTKPRIYKLLALCYNERNDYQNADILLQKYFAAEKDNTNIVAEDYALMAKLAEKNNRPAEIISWLEKAFNKEKNITKQLDYATKISIFYKGIKDYTNQAQWLSKIYTLKKSPSNIDLFNWGIADFHAKNYKSADSVFAMYQDKYPEQAFGYYWRARSNAAIDTGMETEIAVPHYEQLIEIASKDLKNANNKKWVIQAYSYLAAIKANKDKEYDTSLAYYNKVLEIDPANPDALKYKDILEKMIRNRQQIDAEEKGIAKKNEKTHHK